MFCSPSCHPLYYHIKKPFMAFFEMVIHRWTTPFCLGRNQWMFINWKKKLNRNTFLWHFSLYCKYRMLLNHNVYSIEPVDVCCRVGRCQLHLQTKTNMAAEFPINRDFFGLNMSRIHVKSFGNQTGWERIKFFGLGLHQEKSVLHMIALHFLP